jgi:beta-phosphoglucomutase
MKSKMKKLAVIFDMDGVIVDSNHAHKEAINKFCKEHNVELTEERFNQFVNGRQNRDWIPALFGGQLSNEQIIELAREKEELFRKIYLKTIQPLPGLEEFLIKLEKENIPKAIATSAPVENVNFTLEKTGLKKYFTTILDDRNVTIGKPDPQIYINTVEALNYKPSNCVVFEDSLSGIKAARGAGCKVVGVSTTHSAEELKETDLTIKDFRGLSIEALIDLV